MRCCSAQNAGKADKMRNLALCLFLFVLVSTLFFWIHGTRIGLISIVIQACILALSFVFRANAGYIIASSYGIFIFAIFGKQETEGILWSSLILIIINSLLAKWFARSE